MDVFFPVNPSCVERQFDFTVGIVHFATTETNNIFWITLLNKMPTIITKISVFDFKPYGWSWVYLSWKSTRQPLKSVTHNDCDEIFKLTFFSVLPWDFKQKSSFTKWRFGVVGIYQARRVWWQMLSSCIIKRRIKGLWAMTHARTKSRCIPASAALIWTIWFWPKLYVRAILNNCSTLLRFEQLFQGNVLQTTNSAQWVYNLLV